MICKMSSSSKDNSTDNDNVKYISLNASIILIYITKGKVDFILAGNLKTSRMIFTPRASTQEKQTHASPFPPRVWVPKTNRQTVDP